MTHGTIFILVLHLLQFTITLIIYFIPTLIFILVITLASLFTHVLSPSNVIFPYVFIHDYLFIHQSHYRHLDQQPYWVLLILLSALAFYLIIRPELWSLWLIQYLILHVMSIILFLSFLPQFRVIMNAIMTILAIFYSFSLLIFSVPVLDQIFSFLE